MSSLLESVIRFFTKSKKKQLSFEGKSNVKRRDGKTLSKKKKQNWY